MRPQSLFNSIRRPATARRALCAAAFGVASVLLPATAMAGGGKAGETGLWIDDTGKGAVMIEPCGSKLCGRIYWLQEETNDRGEKLMDRYNPDPAKQTRPICGLPVLGNLQAMPEGGYDAGWVYDPKVGKSYSVAIQLANQNTLQVTGYAGIKLLGKTFYWKRAEGELPKCGSAGGGSAAKKKGGEDLPWAAN